MATARTRACLWCANESKHKIKRQTKPKNKRNEENIKIKSTKSELKENQLKTCSNQAGMWMRVRHTFEYFLLPLDTGFSSTLRFGLLLVNISEFGFYAHLPERLRLWVTSGGRVDLQWHNIRIIEVEALLLITLCGVIGVFDWTVAPKVISSSSSLSSTNFCLSIDLSSNSMMCALSSMLWY